VNLANVTPFQKKDFERRVRLGYGEYFTINYKDINEQDEIVEKTNTYYVGRMNAGRLAECWLFSRPSS
jgi:hypothetical protein